MARWPDRWIVPENWSRFQARRERPGAPWIKLWLSLLRKSEWVDLTLEDQGLLANVWLLYAEEDGRLRIADLIRWTFPQATVSSGSDPHVILRKRHHQRISRGLERLNRAGFIGFSDDKPLPLSLRSSEDHARARAAAPNGKVVAAESWLRNVGHTVEPSDLPRFLTADFGLADDEAAELLERWRR